MAAGESYLVMYKTGLIEWGVHKQLDDREQAIRSAQRLAKELHKEVQVFRRVGTVSVETTVEFKLG